jgi:hypothetical protein
MDGKRIEAGEWTERYFVAEFAQSAEALPLHPTGAAKWFRVAAEAAMPSSGSGGVIANDGLPAIPLRRKAS